MGNLPNHLTNFYCALELSEFCVYAQWCKDRENSRSHKLEVGWREKRKYINRKLRSFQLLMGALNSVIVNIEE